jgi:dsRNA-specific ribonuclease
VDVFALAAVDTRVFTRRSAVGVMTSYASLSHAAGSAARWHDDNEHLEFVGDMVLKGLGGMLIDELFPEADEWYMSLGSPSRAYLHGEREGCRV